MNSKLEVVRINEDVIATSGMCSHLSAVDHIKVYDYKETGNCAYYGYTYENGELIGGGTYYDTATTLGISSGGWYWFDGSSYHKCEDQSNEAHFGDK